MMTVGAAFLPQEQLRVAGDAAELCGQRQPSSSV
jgi:hypothetical protein